jgi:glycosyltransferase involved in cell wall biosynthesis
LFTNADLMRALAARHDAYVLACGPDKWVLSRIDGLTTRIEEIKFDAVWRGGERLSADREAALAELLERRHFDIAHVRSLLGSGPEMISALRRGGCRVVVSFHDFTAVCPTVQLLDAAQTYCAGHCTSGELDCPAPAKWFADISRLKNAYVHEWRARMTEALPDASEFVTTSLGAAALVASHFPALEGRIQIIEHGRDVTRRRLAAPPRAGAPVRVVILGVLSRAKGRALVEALVAWNAEQGARFEFHMLGDAAPDFASAPGVVLHGAYEREELPARLKTIAPSFSLIASIWPETYSHTLTESWAAGIPVLASDLGAPGERIRRHGGGWLLDPREPEQWAALLRQVTETPTLWTAKAREIHKMQFRGVRRMAADYRALYERVDAKGDFQG